MAFLSSSSPAVSFTGDSPALSLSLSSLILSSLPVSSFSFSLIPFSPSILPKYSPGGILHNNLFIHLFFLSSDDIDSYKLSHKQLIQDWLSSFSSKKYQDFLIIFLSKNSNPSSSSIFGSSSLHDKIKSDLNIKKDKIISIHSENNFKNSSFDFLINRIKDSLISAISLQISQLQDDAKRLEQQRLMPGWNYLQLFVLKEALAASFELINRFHDSLILYDELEASFLQTLSEQGAPWFHKFGGNEPNDDNPLLFSDQKNLRSRIIQNTISIYDFRIYLFSRQIRLLLLQALHNEACSRSLSFISSFSKTLKEYSSSLFPNFSHAWIYSLSSYMADQISLSAKSIPPSSPFDALHAQLIQTARFQLDYLGFSLGFCQLPPYLPHSQSPSVSSSIPIPESETDSTNNSITTSKTNSISNPVLIDALSSQLAFDSLYTRITETAALGLIQGGRPRSAIALRSDLAHLHFLRNNYDSAAQIWDSILNQFPEPTWHSIQSSILSKLIICHSNLHHHSRLVDCCLSLSSYPSLIPIESIEMSVDQIISSARIMTDTVTQSDSSLFTINILSVTCGIGNLDPVTVTISIYSRFIKPIHMDTLSITLSAGDEKDMSCTINNNIIIPGSNSILLKASKPTIPGTYHPIHFSMIIGNLIFKYTLSSSDRKHSIRIPESSLSLKMTAEIPGESGDDDMPSCIEVKIHVGKDEVKGGRIGLSSLTSINFEWPKMVQVSILSTSSFPESIHPDDMSHQTHMMDCDVMDSKLHLPCLPSHSIVIFRIPYTIPSDTLSTDHKLKIILYTDTMRVYTSIMRVSVLKPVYVGDVTVITDDDDKKNDGCMIRMMIECMTSYPLRIKTMNLCNIDGQVIATCMGTVNGTILMPNVPISIIFRIIHPKITHMDTSLLPKLDTILKTYVLCIEYMTLPDIITSYLMSRIHCILLLRNGIQYMDFFEGIVRKSLIPSMDMCEIVGFGCVRMPVLDEMVLRGNIPDTCGDDGIYDMVLDVMKTLWNDVETDTLFTLNESFDDIVFIKSWKHKMKLKIPCMVFKVMMIQRYLDIPIHVTTPIMFDIIVKPITWSIHHHAMVTVELRLDRFIGIFTCQGKTRTTLTMTYGQECKQEIVLIPLCVGYLSLPVIHTRVLNITIPNDMGIQQSIENMDMNDVCVTYMNIGSYVSVLPKKQSSKLFIPDTPILNMSDLESGDCDDMNGIRYGLSSGISFNTGMGVSPGLKSVGSGVGTLMYAGHVHGRRGSVPTH